MTLQGGGPLTEKDRVKLPRPAVKISTTSQCFFIYHFKPTMAFVNAKRKRIEDNHTDTFFSKSHKRHHSNYVLSSFIDHPAAMQLGDQQTRTMDDIAKTSTRNVYKQHAGSDISEYSAKDNFNSEAELASEPKYSTHPMQPIVPKTLEDSADQAPSLSLKKAQVEPGNTPKPRRAKEYVKERQVNLKTPESSADEVPAVTTKNQPIKTSTAKSVNQATKQKQVSSKVTGSSAGQAPAVKATKAGLSKILAQKQELSSSELSSPDEGHISIADLADIDVEAASKAALAVASTPPSPETSGKGNESEDEDEDDNNSVSRDRNLFGDQFPSDDKTYPSEDEEGEESEPEDEEIRVAQLKAPAEAQARFKRDWLQSDLEPAFSSESSMERASDDAVDSDDEPDPDNKKKANFKSDDPNAFASSMSGILGYKLTKTQRANPILARSADAKEADEALADLKLEKKARAEMRRQKVGKGASEMQTDGMLREIRGEVVGGMDESTLGINEFEEMGSVFAHQRHEKELRKTAERGVVKMFNAFTHVREKAVEAQRMVGSTAKKEEKATKMTKEGWLEYIGHGGKGKIENKVELEKNGEGKEA